jgi:Tol biopolymer transport system component
VRLGDGGFGFISPDGKWVVSRDGSPAKLVLLPTGVGEPRQLTDDKIDHFNIAWMPDGKSILYSSAEEGHQARTYMLAIDGGAPRPLTPEGTVGFLVTPDSRFLLASDIKRQRWLYPIAGGEPQKFTIAAEPNERVMTFFDGGKSVLVRTTTVPVKVTKIDIASGRRDSWKEIAPPDPAGVNSLPSLRFSADGKAYAYSAGRLISDLYVVDGLK